MTETETKSNRPVRMFKIHNGLLDAYRNHYENYTKLEQDDGSFKDRKDFTEEEFEDWIYFKIVTDHPKRRLDIYLHEQGIYGYSNTAYDIAIGKIA